MIKQRVIALVLTIAALAVGQGSAWAQGTSATFPVEVTFQGMMNNGKYAYVITSGLHTPYNSGVQNLTHSDYVRFDEQEFDIGSADVPLNVTVRGNFDFPTTTGDATVYGQNADLVFTSGSKYITAVSVSTYDGTPVSVESITGTRFSRDVFMLMNTTFGKVTLTMATHTPLNYGATIGGIEDTYIDDGVNRPVPTVTYEETSSSPAITLTEGEDYTVSYNVGSTSGTVTVTGIGQYTGSKSKSYNIRQLQLSDFTQLGDGSYEIATKQDLDNLAKFVNKGNQCSGVTFRQTDDIAYSYASEYTWDNVVAATLDDNHNFTPIGGYGKPFKGTYDGGGYTISGILISAHPGTSGTGDQSVGLFGYVSDGTVQNVILRDANIYAYQDFAGIVGYLGGGSVTGCTLYHVRVATPNNNFTNQNIVVGNHASGTVSGNYYRDCIRSRQRYGGAETIERWDNVYAVSTAANTTATYQSGASVTIDDVTYYAEGSTFTLGYSGEVPEGYEVVYNSTGGTISGNMLTMPASDVSVSADVYAPGEIESNPFVVTTWADLKAKMAVGGYIRLDADVTDPDKTSSSYLYVPTGKTVTLDLNGHTIDRGLTEKINNGYVIHVLGTLTLNDSSNPSTGIITGGNTSFGGAVCVPSSGTFTMNGGTISGNTSVSSGGGVYVSSSSTFTMNGGIISGNTSVISGGGVYIINEGSTFTMNGGTISGNTCGTNGHGGGVYIDSGTIHVSGNAVITGNINAAGKEENVYLQSDQYIIIDTPLTAGASIGVTSTDAPPTGGDPVEIATGATDGDSQYFHSDINGLTIEAGQNEQAGKLLLAPPASTPWSELKAQLEAGNDVTLSDNVTVLDCDNNDYASITNTVTLDLNGHTVAGKESMESVFRIGNNGNFTLTDSGTGGTITGNGGYGVRVRSTNSTFTMTGGTITGNTGGVEVYNGTFCVSGSPIITGNTKNGIACNVYLLEEKTINVVGALSADARIGVTTKTAPTPGNPVTFAQGSGSYTLTAADASRFSSDVSEYFVGYDNVYHEAYLTVDDTDANIIIALADNADNSSVITAADGKTRTAVLSGRTLYKDGGWNTLCLPFDIDILNDIIKNESHPLHGATIMTFDPDDWYDANGQIYQDYEDGYHRSGQIENGNLYLYLFKMVEDNSCQGTEISAGEPFFIKWPSGTNIVNPVFSGVTINMDNKYMNVTSREGSDDYAHDGNVTFKSTYAPINFSADDNTKLFVGTGNNLYYPKSGASIGAFRAYFQLGNGITATDITNARMFFGEEDSTVIVEAEANSTHYTLNSKLSEWYTVDGRKLSGKPTAKGLYIYKGKKVAIK